MEPRKVGRTLGIGARVASNMVRERLEQSAKNAKDRQAAPQQNRTVAGNPSVPLTHQVAHGAVTAKRGARAFGQALITPFTHAGGILWLEITGLFFGLFAFFFAQSIYRLRNSWNQPAEHSHLVLYAVLAMGFGWFSVSSFVRARQKTKRGPARRA
jgi:hypothetical protein